MCWQELRPIMVPNEFKYQDMTLTAKGVAA